MKLAALFALVLVACNRTPEPEPSAAAQPKPSVVASAAPSPSASVASAQLAWDAPKSWGRSDKPSPMRKATYTLPKQPGDMDAPELAISVAGGTVDANVDRWVQQFDEDAKATLKKSTRKVGPYDVTIAELKGTWNGSGMTGGGVPPKHGYRMIAAIVPVSDDGKWFFKLIGPEKSVEAARGEFDAFVNSIRPQS
jgi:hypothetical protein